MSAKSRSKKAIQLPLKRDDYIVFMEHRPELDAVVIGTRHERCFVMTRVKGYKRPYKVHELPR
jgi:hypothetical protein